MEPLPADFLTTHACSIDVHSVTKSFNGGKLVAVDNVSLQIYEGQITCLLGHNGAGKTTLTNIMTGISRPTSGGVRLSGYEITNPRQVVQVRDLIGYCPQENSSLNDNLTVYEHLKFFAMFREHQVIAKGRTIEEEINSLLALADLSEKKFTEAKSLSGGQKRKLCLAIALVGRPKVIFLDEPTAGMDPLSRRKFWALLKQVKKGRTIVLTTHFMDEADILADRKAFMSGGRLRCCGSSFFLKNKFGVGYHLTLVVRPDRMEDLRAAAEALREVVAGWVAETQLEFFNSAGQGLLNCQLLLPHASVNRFADMFAAFDRKQLAGCKVVSYGVQMTSLEEVFLRLDHQDNVDSNSVNFNDLLKSDACRQSTLQPSPINELSEGFENPAYMTSKTHFDPVEATAESKGNQISYTTSKDTSAVNLRTILKRSGVTKCQRSTWQTFWALTLLRWRLVIRNPLAPLARLIIPLIFIVMGLITQRVLTEYTDTKEPLNLDFSSDQLPYAKDMKLAWIGGQLTNELKTYIERLYSGGSGVEFFEEWPNDSYWLPNAPFVGAIAPSSENNQTLTIRYNSSAISAAPMLVSLTMNIFAVLANIELVSPPVSTFDLWSEPFPLGEAIGNVLGFAGGITVAMMFGIVFLYAPSRFAVDVVKDRHSKCKNQLRVSGCTPLMYWTTTFCVDLIKFLFVPIAAFIIILCFQEESLLTGGAPFVIWLLFIGTCTNLLLHAYTWSWAFENPDTCEAILPWYFFGVGLLSFLAWILLEFLAKAGIASFYAITAIFPQFHLIGGLMIVVLYHMTQKIVQSFGFDADFSVKAFIMGQGSSTLGNDDIFSSITKDRVLIILIAMLAHTILYVIILVAIEWHLLYSNRKAFKHGATQKEIPVDAEQTRLLANDPLVLEEIRQVNEEVLKLDDFRNTGILTADGGQTMSTVLVSHLRRYFATKARPPGYSGPPFKTCGGLLNRFGKLAVKELSLSVKPGEVFGLLGPNGAGKTTAIAIMTGETQPTDGRVYIDKMPMGASGGTDCANVLGYCPQQNTIWEDVTLQEHLELFATVSGLTEEPARSQVVSYFIQSLGIQEHAGKRAKTLSGGTKRKLNFALAMLGPEQRAVFLDEPSTGMDPKTKRFLWETIKATFYQSSDRDTRQEVGTADELPCAVLTTHYMEEAEALCARIGIMVMGELMCVGALQQLISRYGSGYRLEVKLRESNESPVGIDGVGDDNVAPLEERVAALKDFVSGRMPGGHVDEEFDTRVSFVLPQSSIDALGGLGAAFALMEAARQQLTVEDYSLSQTSLEQMFLHFAKLQLDSEH